MPTEPAFFVPASEQELLRFTSDKREVRLNAFTSHSPSPEVQAIMTRVRESYQALAGLLDGAIPESREKSLAFTALEESAMWAIKALALTDHGGVVDPPPAS